jgi:hypothetical protein
MQTISRGAKGLVLELSSHAQGRRLTLEEIVAASADGRHSTRARIAELVEAGLLTRHQERDQYGRLGATVYRLHVQPQATASTLSGKQTCRSEPLSGFPTADYPTAGNPTADGPTTENQTAVETCRSEPLSGKPTAGNPTSGEPTTENRPTSKKTRKDKTPSSSDVADGASDQEPRSDVEQLCSVLRDRMIENGCKAPTVGKSWREAARLLLDRDRRPFDEALDVLAWSQADEFWHTNIHSLPTFRTKYDQLRLKWQQSNPVRYLRSDDAIRNWLREQWRQGHVKAIEERSGLRYTAPDLPEGIRSVDEAKAFHAQAIRDWITDHHDELITLIQRREQPVAS